MAFPFFSMGYLLIKIEDFKFFERNGFLISTWLISAVLFLIESYSVIYFKVQKNIILTFSLYILLLITMLLLLNNPLNKFQKAADISGTIANFTYYAHPLFQKFLVLFAKYTNIRIPDLFVFILTMILTFVFGVIYYLLINKKNVRCVVTPKIY